MIRRPRISTLSPYTTLSRPLFRRYHVNAYICGHDHDMELIGGHPPILISGAGSGLDVMKPRRAAGERSEEHTSELQSPCNLVCRLLLEKKNPLFRGGRTADH